MDTSDSRPWAVAWSGGKDSTCVMKLVTDVLVELPKEQRTRHIYAVMSNTLAENPEVDVYMRTQADLLNKWAKENDMPISAHIVERKPDNGYFYLLLGKGYRLPDNKFRWCTDKLKIRPQEKFLKEINPVYVLSGVRSSESRQRANSIEKFRLDDKMARYEGYLGEQETKVFMPIVLFTVEDVWAVLKDYLHWSSTRDIRRIYREATGECGFINPKGTETSFEACGARFGCWTCPVIKKDKSTEAMAAHNRWMLPLTKWRILQNKVYGNYVPPPPAFKIPRKERSAELRRWEEINAKTRLMTKSGYDRKGKRLKDGQGCLSVEARRFLLEELMKTQEEVNRLRREEGLEPIDLVDKAELELIHKQLEEDYNERPWLRHGSVPFDKNYLLNEI